MFFKILSRFLGIGLKSFKKYDLKNFSSQNLKMGIKRNQNFTLISKLLRKNTKHLLTKELQAKEVCKIGVCPLLYWY